MFLVKIGQNRRMVRPRLSTTSKNIFNTLTFYLIWWLYAWKGTHWSNLTNLGIGLIYIALHYLLIVNRFRRESLLIALTIAIGLAEDFVFNSLGLFSFGNGFEVWLPIIWFAFGSSLDHSMASILRRPLWSAVAAMIFAPLSYYTASRSALVIIHWPMGMIHILFCLWWAALGGLILPILQRYSNALFSRP